MQGCLARHPAVGKVCVVGIPDHAGDTQLKAFVVLRPGSTVTETELGDWSRDTKTGLAAYPVPRSFAFRESLPETLIGKVLRRKLLEEELVAAGAEDGARAEAPS